MDLILWRHAHAETLDMEATLRLDPERKLTLKGQKQAAKMALWHPADRHGAGPQIQSGV